MTWDEIYLNADGSACGEYALKVKDNARWNVQNFVLEKEGEDIESSECPEDSVEYYTEKYSILFNEDGNIISFNTP